MRKKIVTRKAKETTERRKGFDGKRRRYRCTYLTIPGGALGAGKVADLEIVFLHPK
jgi:hypothetical protein